MRNLTKKGERYGRRMEEGGWKDPRAMNNRVGLSELCDAARC